MKAAHLQESRAKSLRDEIDQSIKNTKFKSVSHFLRGTRNRQHHQHPNSSQPSHPPRSSNSLRMPSDISPPRFSFSPPSQHVPRASGHHSTDYSKMKSIVPTRRSPVFIVISKGSPKQNYDLSHPKERTFSNQTKPLLEKRHKTTVSPIGTNYMVKPKGRQSNSRQRDRGSSPLDLSSILQQQSSESRLVTPSKGRKSRYRQCRRQSGDRTKKKDKRGVRNMVWQKLQKSVREPQKFQRLLKNDIIGIRFRVLRKKLLEIQIQNCRSMLALNLNLHKGNLQCQESGSVFSLYSAVRSIDLNEPFLLPKLLITASLNQEEKYEKFITLPYCWLHLVQQSNTRQISRSRIKTKVCLAEMSCSKQSLGVLNGVLPRWKCQYGGRNCNLWQSRWIIGDQEFEFHVVERDGHFMGELCGRGEERLTKMLEFLEQMIN